MATYNKFESFVEAVAHKKHNLNTNALGGDQLTIALCNAANPPVVGNSVLGDLTVIAYTNLSTRDLTVTGSAQSSGKFKITVTDTTLTASGGAVAPFQYLVVYNETATNDELICWFDYLSDLILADGEYLDVNFDDLNGLFDLE